MTLCRVGASCDDACERTDNKSAPERSCNSMCSGASPTSERTDRLMPIVDPTSDTPPPSRPALCPLCGLTADNAVTVRSELTATATYCDTRGHLWSVTWLEVAA